MTLINGIYYGIYYGVNIKAYELSWKVNVTIYLVLLSV